MCGRVFVKSTFAELMAAFAEVRREGNLADIEPGPRYNGAPSLTYPIIVHDAHSVCGAFSKARWGLVPSWVKEAKPKVQPANARCESLKTNGMFRGAYRSRRCLLPIDGYYEWRSIKGRKQPYALARPMGSRSALPPSGGAAARSVCTPGHRAKDVRGGHLPSERARGHHPRSNAGDPPPEGLCALAWRGA